MSYLFDNHIAPSLTARYVVPAIAVLGLGFVFMAAKISSDSPSMELSGDTHVERRGSSERARNRQQAASVQLPDSTTTNAASNKGPSVGSSHRARVRAEQAPSSPAFDTPTELLNTEAKSGILTRRHSRGTR